MKRLTCFIFIFLLSTYAYAKPGIYVGAGYSQYDHHYKPAMGYGAGIELYNKATGLSLGFGFHYTKATPKANQPTLRHLVMPSTELRYYFGEPYRTFTPYIGANFQINRLSAQFDDPSMGFGLIVGTTFRIDPTVLLFAQGERNMYSDDTTKTDINGWTVRSGVQFKMTHRKKYQPQKNKHARSYKGKLPAFKRRNSNRRNRPIHRRRTIPENPYNKVLTE